MTNTQRKRDPRYKRTVGEKPNQGRRYVENGKVKIEWYEGGKRRSRTIGSNSANVRREADEELERLLGLTDAEPENDEDLEEECPELDISRLIDGFRCHAEALMDFADDLADSFEKGLVNVLSVFGRSDDRGDAEDAEVVEESEDTDESEESE